ncbi:WW domain-containing adapter protein with coiled-coil-like isoform X1 [Orbicella faveolata]|uniref:WW domain-containing adapter protein with coiled-coil-like isoform X1 n=1 Tax=Orbicella faveolata TaxID=48498 RepID=UPI0009E3DE93|nr:WW domain-containing adapter protein with coiled-coil-like isoform X1 [Orbicella faveolata]
MSNRKYPRLADGYHDRSQYHPYQASSKFSSKSHSNCNSESGRERERSPVGSSISRGSSPYSRHSNFSPRSHRSKSYNRSRESSKRGSSKSPTDAHSHHTLPNSNSHGNERHSKPNHVNSDEAFVWSQHTSSSGKMYYYNCKTEKSQWEKPKEWIERERREKERKDKEKRDFVGSKDGRDIRGDSSLHREHLASSKPSKYMSPSKSIHRDYHSSADKREGNHADIRNFSGEQKKDMQRLSESMDRGHQVVKTCSVHTAALPTVVFRPNPVVANFGGETAVSPAGSLQDVSPPTTPSSRPSIYDQSSHTPSPNVITSVSPQVPQHHGVPSPQLQFPQQSPQFPPRHGLPLAQNAFPQVPVSGAPRAPQQYQFAPHQYVVPQQTIQPVLPQMNDYRQYALVNSTGPPLPQVSQQVSTAPLPLAVQVQSPQPVVFNKQVSPQPVLHPLQQATLVLQQRKMSEAQAAAAAGNIQQPYAIAAATNALPPTAGLPQQAVSPVTVGLHRKDDRPHHSSPGSPVVFSQQPSLNEHTPHHSSQQVPPLSAASSNLVSSSPLSHSSNASSPVPVAQPSVPTVNLQAIAKYVDKNLTSHLSSWPTETVDRQLQKLWEESSCYSNDSDKAKIEQIRLQSEVGFMEMRLETASRRISSLKGMTRTLEALLAESDAKFLS